MKNKLLLTLLSIVCVLCCVFALVACDNTSSDNVGNGGKDEDNTDKNPVVETKISLNKTNVQWTLGDGALGFTLEATVYPSDAESEGIRWTVSDPNKAQITPSEKNTCYVEPHAEGNVIVTAAVDIKGAEPVEANCYISISAPEYINVDRVELSQEEYFLKVGDELTLSYTVTPAKAVETNPVTFEIVSYGEDMSSIATVSDDGKVTAVGDGTVYVRVHCGYKVGGCYIRINSSTAGLRIYETYDDASVDAFFPQSDEPVDVVIPATYMGLPVTNISYSAFKETNIKSVVIPSSIQEIKSDAFENCESLQTVTICGNITDCGDIFRGCCNLTDIIFADGVTTVDLTYLYTTEDNSVNVSIPDSVTQIIGNYGYGHHPFVGNLYKGMYYLGNENNPYLAMYMMDTSQEQVLDEDFIHPDTKMILTNALNTFGQSFSLNFTELVIPEGVVSIYDGAFEGNSEFFNSIISIQLPASLTSIVNNFGNFYNVTAINVAAENPNYRVVNNILYNKDVTSIYYIPSKTTGIVTLPATLETMDDIWSSPVYTAISGFEVEEGNTHFFAQSGQLYNFERTELICPIYKAGGEIVIPYGITEIPEYWFRGNKNITSIVIPNSVQTIAKFAFYECNNLEKMTLPFVGGSRDAAYYGNYDDADKAAAHFGYIFGAAVRVTSNTYGLPDNASYVPAKLKEVIITDQIGTEYYAFYGCNNIERIEFSREPVVGDHAVIKYHTFEGCTSLKVLILADGVRQIEAGALAGADDLSIVLRASVIDIVNEPGKEGWKVFFDGLKSSYQIASQALSNGTIYYAGEWEIVDGVPTVKE